MRAIATASYAKGNVDIFWPDKNLTLWHAASSGSAWSADFNVGFGQTFVSVPAATGCMAPPPQSQNPRARRHRAPAPRVDVFALGPDFSMRQQTTWNGALETGGWNDLGGIVTSAPAAIAWNRDRIDVFGVGLDAAMYQRTVAGSSISQN